MSERLETRVSGVRQHLCGLQGRGSCMARLAAPRLHCQLARCRFYISRYMLCKRGQGIPSAMLLHAFIQTRNYARRHADSDELTSHHEPRSAFLCVAGTKSLSMLPAGASIKWNHRRGQVVWHDAHGRPIRLFCLSCHVCRPVGRLADRLGRAAAWRARRRGSGVARLAKRSTQAGLLQ